MEASKRGPGVGTLPLHETLGGATSRLDWAARIRRRHDAAPRTIANASFPEEQAQEVNGGAGGIRTLDTVLPYTHFPGERLRPLGHRSACSGTRPSREARRLDQ